MKKFLIAIIVILSVLLIGQLAYYNFRNNNLDKVIENSINTNNNLL